MSEVKKIKPSLSKGTRDFLPQEVAKRNYIFDTIKSVFRKYGFEQIETPAIERLETLTGKYGEEGDKLLFKILNSGDYLKDTPADLLTNKNSSATTSYIAEKGLRYDLTVPLARYVVQHQEDLAFPFKRFHIGPVWRADRPQKGRYQEFYQCDADVIGSPSELCEVELTTIYIEAFQKLNLPVRIKVNERGILNALSIALLKKSGNVNKSGDLASQDFLTVLDKVDKIGMNEAKKELQSKGYEEQAVTVIWDIISTVMSGRTFLERIELLKQQRDLMGLTGLEDWLFWDSAISKLERFNQYVSSNNVEFDITLARGLNYYTGVIWEVLPNADIKIGSIGGGGRYANLTEMFGGQNMTGVGISFGIERIYDVMEELNLFPAAIAQGVKVLFVPRDADAEAFTFEQVQTLRNEGIAAEIFLGNVKKQKHFAYAEQKGVPYMVEIGANETESKQFRLRNVTERKEEGNGWTIEQMVQKFI